MNRILYLSFDGILEPLGYSQILSYLKHLSSNFNITIISVEKKNDVLNTTHFNMINKEIKDANIDWIFLNYSNNKIGKIILIIKLFFKIAYILKKKKINIIHARSYITGLLSFFLKKILNFYLIFDIRGFWIEERINWGLWNKNTIKYKIFKYFEGNLFRKSDIIVTLTNDAKKIILDNKNLNLKKSNIFVVPTSVNLANQKSISNNSDKLVFTHLGAIGSRYNFEAYLKVTNKIYQSKKVFLSIINKGEHIKIKKNLDKYNINKNNFKINFVPPYNINFEIQKSNFGIFFPVSGFYLKAYFPTKLGEFLTNGIPVITLKINEHVDSIILQNNVGILIDNIDNINYESLTLKIKLLLNDKNITKRCQFVAKKYFNIKNAVETYSEIYTKITK